LTERRDIGARLENWARVFQQARAGQPQDRRAFDHADAQLLEQAMPALPNMQRSLLWWCYVRQETPETVCRRVGIVQRPATHFIDAFRTAQATVQALAEAAVLPQHEPTGDCP
jgi:hypothetical protein